jgi:hypothetical protein
MDILPDKSTFIKLAASSTRVPVFGQKNIPDLNLSKLFQDLFLQTKNSFLFESSKGPKKTVSIKTFFLLITFLIFGEAGSGS